MVRIASSKTIMTTKTDVDTTQKESFVETSNKITLKRNHNNQYYCWLLVVLSNLLKRKLKLDLCNQSIVIKTLTGYTHLQLVGKNMQLLVLYHQFLIHKVIIATFLHCFFRNTVNSQKHNDLLNTTTTPPDTTTISTIASVFCIE